MTMPSDLDRGPLHRHREGDSLWYVQPLTQERFISVTSVNDFAEKAGLSDYWKPGQAAKSAFEELPKLNAASRKRPCGRTYARCQHEWNETCDGCPCEICRECVTSWLTRRHFAESKRATDRGKAFHKYVEFWVLHDGYSRDVSPEIQPYVDTFQRFVNDFGLSPRSWEMSEATVLNRSHPRGTTAGWGGTLDARVRFDATASKHAYDLCSRFGMATPLLSLDTKTREAEDAAFYGEMALQLAAYRRGQVVLMDDGTEVPLGPDDGGVVVQIRPDGYGWRPVLTDDVTYRGFVDLMGFALWSIEWAAKSVQVKTFPKLEIPGLEPPKPVRKTAPRKAVKPAGEPKKTVAPSAPAARRPVQSATRSATLASLTGHREPHPDSPLGDGIPF